ncbi:MAG: A/G-specific adenine glycosylase [Bacteroidetes bacterium]|nr:A/G-specific adenine glycosylase [Bacteroidota bacterium]
MFLSLNGHSMGWENELMNWYKVNHRELPWRKEANGYLTWISEVILQQTRVAQGIPYFLRFIERFPTVKDLANADEQEVLLLWQGLGYYSRARNLHQGAKQIVENLNSDFNHAPEILMKVRGIGHYTANAIASLTYDYPIPVVDGNVYRVTTRLWGITDPIPSERARKMITSLLQTSVEHFKPSIFNQALMELGALVCLPQNPKCELCPLQIYCFAYQNKQQNLFPIKIEKKKPQSLYLSYFHFNDVHGKTLIYKRNKGIWQNLYEFPSVESNKHFNKADAQMQLKGLEIKSIEKRLSLKHQLTHKTIFAIFWEIKVQKLPLNGNFHTFEIHLDEIENYPIHQLMKKYINSL